MPYGHVKQYRDLVREAQKKRIRITKEQQKEIGKLYGEIAADLSSRLSRHSDQTLTYRWLKDYAKELRRESRGVYRTIQGITEKNMLAVTSAVTGAESAFWGGLVPELSERFADVFSKIPDSVVNELLSGGVYRDFTGLSERIWNYQGKFNRDIQYVINQGIIAKKPAYDLAKDLEIYLNPKAAKPFDWSRVYPGIHKTVDYNAQRLARTGVTHAYQMSFQRSTRENPFIEKYKWLSSNSGRSCELCRQRNGRLFEKDELPLDHPNGMCTVIAVIPKSYEQIADELADWANGKENPKLEKWLNPEKKRNIIKEQNISPAALRKRQKDEVTLAKLEKERAIIYDSHGNVKLIKNGIEDSVSFTDAQIMDMEGCILSHNHPNNSTFSPDDINMLRQTGLLEIRAVTKDGVFILKNTYLWDSNFNSYEKIVNECQKEITRLKPEMMNRYRNGELTAEEYSQEIQAKAMEQIAKRFHLDYSFERRK